MPKEIDIDTLDNSNEQADIKTPDDSKKRVNNNKPNNSKKRVLKIGVFAILVFIVILIGFVIVFYVMNETSTNPPKQKEPKSTPSATAKPARLAASASTSKQTVAPAVTESSAPKEHLNSDIKLESNDNNGYFKRGYAYYALGKYALAIKDYNEAIRLKPDEVDEYNNRGVAYAYLKEYNKAQEDFDKAIRLKPDDPSAYYNYACMFALQKDFTQSCKWLQQAMEKGYKDWKHLNEDKDFDNIRNSSCLIDILKKYGK